MQCIAVVRNFRVQSGFGKARLCVVAECAIAGEDLETFCVAI